MDEILNEQEGMGEGSSYATPFNVDLFGSKPKNFFTEYTNRVLALPESVRNILMDPSTAEFIEENLGPSFGLNKDQKAEATRIIRDVLLGDISINEMAGKISENLGIDSAVAYQIQSKIVNELFASVIGDLKNMQKGLSPQKSLEPPQQYRPPVRSGPPQYIPPPLRNQEPPVSPGNVVDLRNQK
ncbi:MAG: hypothetical protein HYT67_01185 [Candidatus Yanofskybacteria bacterium]|nr:hypothetical protein [Candidatus Yanofskybacteria bacterium]